MSHSKLDPSRRAAAFRTPALAALAVAIALGLGGQAHAATFTVTNTDDAGEGSLRAAIALANVTPGADSIAFEAGLTGTIALDGQIGILEDLAIVGPGLALIALDGGENNRIFDIGVKGIPAAALQVSIQGLTLQNGFSGGDGGCVQAWDTALQLVDSLVTGCVAGEGNGGGVVLRTSRFNKAAGKGNTVPPNSLLVSGSRIENNRALGSGGGISAEIYATAPGMENGVQIVDSTISDNTTGNGPGGGVELFGYDPFDIEVRGTTISGNTADSFAGGGMAVYQAYAQDANIALVDNVVSGNTLRLPPSESYLNTGGGGIWIGAAATTQVSGGRFENNRVEPSEVIPTSKGIDVEVPPVGGGLATVAVDGTTPSVTVRDAVFVGNEAPYGGGFGAALIASSGPVGKQAQAGRWYGRADGSVPVRTAPRTPAKGVVSVPGVYVVDTTFDANTATGGAAVLTNVGDLSAVPQGKGVVERQALFERVTASGNTSTGGEVFGIGAMMLANLGVVAQVTDSTVSGNTGGGIAGFHDPIIGAGVAVDNSTVVDNTLFGVGFIAPMALQNRWIATAAARGKAYPPVDNALAVRNSIVHGNTGDDGVTAADILSSDAPYLLHNLIGMSEAAVGAFDGSGNLFATDPLLGPLADNGGPTLTHLPLEGSPALDAGDPDFAEPPSVDQRGLPRVAGDALDIGAVEVALAPPEPGVLQLDPPADGMLVEVNSPATFTVTRTGGSDGEATVAYATSDLTATAGVDYATTAGTLTWADGDAEPKTFTVAIVNDTDVEADETLRIALSDATGAALGAYIATTLTIIDDDVLPPEPGVLGFTATAVSIDEDAGIATLTVGRTDGDDGEVSVTWASSNGTATAGADYTAAGGTLTWADGDVAAKTFTVPIIDDALDEADETFSVTLGAPTGDATLGAIAATVTILDNDLPPPPGVVQFEGADPDGVLRLRINEDGTTASPAKGLLTVDVLRSEGSAGPASVDFSTVDGSATAPADYATTAGTLTWADGETGAKSIAISIVEDDGTVEPDETFGIVLSNAQGAGINGDPEAEITIVANGTAVPPAALPAMIPAGDWRGKLALFGALLLGGWIALRRRMF